jgi:hypothetical protein
VYRIERSPKYAYLHINPTVTKSPVTSKIFFW